MTNKLDPYGITPRKHVILKDSLSHVLLDKIADMHGLLAGFRKACLEHGTKQDKRDAKCLRGIMAVIEDNFGEYLETPVTEIGNDKKPETN